MTFPEKLLRLVERHGVGTSATICGVNRRTIHLWITGSTPNLATQTGAIALLSRKRARAQNARR